jgi:hypothetical protein
MSDSEPRQGELSHEEKRQNILRLAFHGDEAAFDAFCTTIREIIPSGTRVVLRGSAVTGVRWKDGAPFDADGPGTSDLDLTLVGADVLGAFKVTGMFVPGVHSRPLGDGDPDIAPAFVELREQLTRMAGRPVNIQATRDVVMFLRGDVLGQPYFTLIDGDGTLDPDSALDADAAIGDVTGDDGT